MTPEDYHQMEQGTSVKMTTRICVAVVLLTMTLTGGCVGERWVQGRICLSLLSAQGVPDTAKAQFLQSGACMAATKVGGR